MTGSQRDLTINHFADGTATAYCEGLSVILHRSAATSCPWLVTMLNEVGDQVCQHHVRTEQDACEIFDRMTRRLATRIRPSAHLFNDAVADERAALALYR